MNLNNIILEQESTIRLFFFFGTLILMSIWEFFSPKRVYLLSKISRVSHNLALVFFNSFCIKLILPLATTSFALLVSQHNLGLFNVLEFNFYVEVVLFILIMDMIIYFQHRIFHKIPVLWSLHKVHHADLDYDVTTGLRFHTLEIFISLLIKFFFFILLGPSVLAVIIFEVVLNSSSMFNHSNISLSKSVDKIVRLFIVTPDMHRVHHSIEENETNSNYGFFISIWDKVFSTYKEDAQKGQDNMIFGIKSIREAKNTNNIFAMLLMPFKRNRV
jgi:sterol desaturase/sphingolipid hydroxylase (fatty acid hydroxylase superfamily)